MADTNNKPVIFLAFANDRDDAVRYLRNLPDEARRLREVLEPAERAGLCQVLVRSNSTASDIFKVFQDSQYRNRIAIFHYGGHANGYQLLLESAAGQAAAADAGGLAAFLAQQQGLQLIFLNGCSTQKQTDGLLDANISAVISTSRAIEDQVATDFSFQFYQGLAGGTSIRTAYNEAEASVQTAKGGDTRSLYFGAKDDSESPLATDRWPWSLYLREGSENADQWNLPDAVNDPLFGLPPLPELDLPESPYRHLSWFTRKDAEVFFGRGRQIRELFDRLTAPRTAPIMLFYGQSGVGKSSILDAGLIPRLERDHEVRYLRRTEGGLLDTLGLAFLLAAAGEPIETAWRANEEQTGKPLIVFLDQVEELYTRPVANLPDELDQLLKVVKATFVESGQRPKGKLVLGFRKEWLAELESQLVAYELPRTKVFLEPLDRRGIIEVVNGPARSERLRESYGLTIEHGLAEIIADDLLADRDSAIAPTLQILLTKMWAKAKEENFEHPRSTQEVYQHLKRDGILLRDFLNQQIATIRKRYPEAVDSGLLLDIVALHTTPLGTADECSVEELRQQYAHLGATLPDVLQQCQDLHLLTVATTARKESAKTTRLAHDTLAPLVREQFDASDKPGQRARRILENRSVDWKDHQQGTPLDEADLTVVEQGASGTRTLNATEQRLLAASRELRAKLKRTRRYQWIAAAGAMIVLAIVVVAAQRRQNSAEATRLVNGLLQADISQVSGIIEKDLPDYRHWAEDDLKTAFDESNSESNAKLHAALAMLPDETVLPFLKKRLLTVSPIQFEHAQTLMDNDKTELIPGYWEIANVTGQDAKRRFQAACALANYDPDNEHWQDPKFVEFVAGHLVGVLPSELLPWRNALRPAKVHLTGSLSAIYRNSKEGEQIRSFAADTLADYLSENPDGLFDLLADASQKQFAPIFDKLTDHQDRAVELGKTEVARTSAEDANEDDKEALAMRQANAAVMLLRMKAPDSVWPLLKHSPDPRVRSYIIHWLIPLGGDPKQFIARYETETDVTIKRALLLCLGEFDESRLPGGERKSLIETLLAVYRSGPDAGLHGAAEWVLRQWKQGEQIVAIDKELQQTEAQLVANKDNKRQWYINEQSQTFVILDADEFQMGSHDSEAGHQSGEVLHQRKIGRRFAISTKEVTHEQWREFSKSHVEMEHPADQDGLKQYIRTDDSPMAAMTWYEAAWYCNWLSEQEGIPEQQWCYKKNDIDEYGPDMKAKDNFLDLSGYRLPTEAEWEFACRAGAETSRYYGVTETLLPKYAWYLANGDEQTHAVASLKPNDFGIFDMQGNVWDWCYDEFVGYLPVSEKAAADEPGTEAVSDTDIRVLRGGSFNFSAPTVRSAYRFNLAQSNYRNNIIGFRLARTYHLVP